jgi:hypothetical protein
VPFPLLLALLLLLLGFCVCFEWLWKILQYYWGGGGGCGPPRETGPKETPRAGGCWPPPRLVGTTPSPSIQVCVCFFCFVWWGGMNFFFLYKNNKPIGSPPIQIGRPRCSPPHFGWRVEGGGKEREIHVYLQPHRLPRWEAPSPLPPDIKRRNPPPSCLPPPSPPTPNAGHACNQTKQNLKKSCCMNWGFVASSCRQSACTALGKSQGGRQFGIDSLSPSLHLSLFPSSLPMSLSVCTQVRDLALATTGKGGGRDMFVGAGLKQSSNRTNPNPSPFPPPFLAIKNNKSTVTSQAPPPCPLCVNGKQI